ncbi:MAG TPA: hypothetical protein VFP65_09910 [Anaeromyxobacteraceae bacterium]|nr:hypothetical protein [Anaeromyxobacteraceae bacterium]
MKRTVASLAIAASLAACGGGSRTLTAEEARGAVPGADQARLSAPDASSASAAAPRGNFVLTAGQAEYARDTMALAGAVNLGVVWTLGVVELVVSFPPTACSGPTCTWGPWGADQPFEVNLWQLTVTKVDDGEYQWALSGQPKATPAAAFTAVVSGTAFPSGVRHVGHGSFVLDLDAAAALPRKLGDPGAQKGRIEATYDNRTSRQVGVQFLGTQDDQNPDQLVNAAYQFVAGASGGDLQVATRNLTTGARLTLHSRWTAAGAGRGDASFSLDGNTIVRSQCWDSNAASPAFGLLYQATSPIAAPDDGGSEASCAFSPAAPPSIQAP